MQIPDHPEPVGEEEGVLVRHVRTLPTTIPEYDGKRHSAWLVFAFYSLGGEPVVADTRLGDRTCKWL